MSIRKFLKEVGVTSQKVIENAWSKENLPIGSKIDAKIVLTIEGLNIEHVVKGEIKS